MQNVKSRFEYGTSSSIVRPFNFTISSPFFKRGTEWTIFTQLQILCLIHSHASCSTINKYNLIWINNIVVILQEITILWVKIVYKTKFLVVDVIKISTHNRCSSISRHFSLSSMSSRFLAHTPFNIYASNFNGNLITWDCFSPSLSR